jgi:catechol 2,3-dioxygenase-like lactoylglutathione lyase family enzyme
VIVAIDHVQLAMPPGGEGRAREFYAGVLALVEVAKPAHLAARGGCWFENATVRVHLGVEREFQPARKAHPAFRVGELASLVARCRDHGATVYDEEQREGERRAYVDDPFGNRIELIEPL